MSDWNDSIIKEFRENDGRVGGNFANTHLLLLTTTGAKSGEKRIAPVMYFTDADGIYVIASKAGTPENPAWYHNLLAEPEVTVERATDGGIKSYAATATAVDRDERDELWAKFSAQAPNFAQYQEKTERVIPIVAILPR